jgi:hypothetical protein
MEVGTGWLWPVADRRHATPTDYFPTRSGRSGEEIDIAGRIAAVGFGDKWPAQAVLHRFYAFGSMPQSGRTVPSDVIPRATAILTDS